MACKWHTVFEIIKLHSAKPKGQTLARRPVNWPQKPGVWTLLLVRQSLSWRGFKGSRAVAEKVKMAAEWLLFV